MNIKQRLSDLKLGRNNVIWIVIGSLLLLYGLVTGNIVSLLVTIAALLIGITVHEFAHAWTADRLGDPTARYMGRVSLNPLVHLDPLGTLMMGITAIIGMGFGWGKPVPIVPYRLKYGRRLGAGIVSIAGPIANLIVATLLGLVFRLVYALSVRDSDFPSFLLYLLSMIVLMNLVLALFNLIPLPPLDGHGVLQGILSLFRGKWAWQVSDFLARLEARGPIILIMVIVISQFVGLNLIGWLIGPPVSFLFNLITGIRF